MESKKSSSCSIEYRREYYKKRRSDPITLQDILDASARFWSWVHVGKPDECWIWFGASQLVGYGAFGLKSRNLIASRVAWIIAHRKMIPSGKIIMHTCDNPSCVNPAHLLLGTQADNMRDASTKGRKNW